MPRLRLAQASDLDAFYSISLATGLAGNDAAHLYEDGMLVGHIYSAPYAQYPDPGGASSDWTADQKRWAIIHHPERTPTNIAQEYPAHVHLNMLPRRQNQGLGAMLFEAWLELA